jgi:uncharacterized membrane protein
MVFVITPFAFGAPSLVAMIMNLARRNAVRSTWLDSHFRWQMETLIIAAIVVICVSPFIFTFVLNPLIYGTYVATGLWAAWRIARGWLALKEHRLAPTQRTLI